MAAASVGVANWSGPFGMLFAALLGVIGAAVCGWRVGLAWLVIGWLAASVFILRSDAQKWDELNLVGVSGVEREGRVLQDATPRGLFWSAPVALTHGARAGAHVWWEGRGEAPVAGARVKARGSFLALPGPRNPGEFNKAEWLRGKGVAAVFQANSLEGEVVTGPWAAWGSKIRKGFRTAVAHGLVEGSPEAAVILAVVIGEQPPNAADLVDAFRNSGTLHAFSVSGLHVAMVGSIGWVLLRFFGVTRRWAVLGLLPMIFTYAWLTGNNPPAVRSAWMALVFLGAFVTRRRPDLLNALGAVLLAATLWDGRLLFQAGVQLSYGVVAAIAVGTRWASKGFAWIAKPELYLPLGEMTWAQRTSLHLRSNLAQSLAVSVAAGIGSTPLTAFHFRLFTPISVLAGVVLVPLVFVLLCASLFAATLYPVMPPAAAMVNQANAFVARVCIMAAQGFAAIPGGHFKLDSREPGLLVYDLDGGAGASVFSGGAGAAVLLDCADPYGFERRVVPSLRRLGLVPDSVVLSHPDGQHLGGGSPVWQTFPIRQAILPVEKSRSPAFRAWLAEAPLAGVLTLQASAVRQLPLPDDARLEILLSPDPTSQYIPADNRVTIFKIHWRGWKILFTGDAGIATEQKLLRSDRDLSADVIVAGRHRSDDSLCDSFLNAVRPQAIIASHSDFPREEKLDPEIVQYWMSRGIRVFNQGDTGGVSLQVDPAGKLRIVGFVDQSTATLTPR